MGKTGKTATVTSHTHFNSRRSHRSVRLQLHTRAPNKRADYVLFHRPNMPIAVIEAKDNKHSLGDGMQQGLGYAEMLQVPFVFSSNGDGFLFHNKIAKDGVIERELALHEIPSPDTLWQWWSGHLGLNTAQSELVSQDYYSDGSNKSPRYYQLLAINKTIEAIAKGQNRILLVMATGTGKTYTAFQTMTNDFKPYKITIDRRLWPDVFKNLDTSVAKAKKPIADYRRAIGQAEGLAELMVFYCERAAGFSNDVGLQDARDEWPGF